MEPRPTFTSWTNCANASATSTFERMERWGSSSDTGPGSGPPAGEEIGGFLLVVRQAERRLLGEEPVGEEVDLHVLEGGDVLARDRPLAVGDENHRVRARAHDPAGGVVLHLA